MPRKIRLSSRQRDLLWLLEEAGEEDLACIEATLKPDDRDEFYREVAALERLGFVLWSTDTSSGRKTLVLTKVGRESLER